MSQSPVPLKNEEVKPQPYEIVLTFNEKAELIDVAAPENMEKGLLIEHLAVATQYVGQTIWKKDE